MLFRSEPTTNQDQQSAAGEGVEDNPENEPQEFTNETFINPATLTAYYVKIIMFIILFQ